MSAEENKALIRRFIAQVYDKGDPDATDELLAPEYVHYVHGKAAFSGPQGMKDTMRMWLGGLPDLQTRIEDMVAEDDRVVVRMTHRGTHKGTMWGYPATGNAVTTTSNTIFRIANGKVTEGWEEWDKAGFIEQLAANRAG